MLAVYTYNWSPAKFDNLPTWVYSSCHPIPDIPVQVHPAGITYRIPRNKPTLPRVVIPMRQQQQTRLAVRIVPPLAAVPEGVSRGCCQRVPPGVIRGGGEDVLAPVQPLDHAALRVEGVIDARGASPSGKEAVCTPNVYCSHSTRRIQFQERGIAIVNCTFYDLQLDIIFF